MKKNINQIAFNLLKKARAVVQKTSRKNVTTAFFFSVFLMDIMGGKNHDKLKRTALK